MNTHKTYIPLIRPVLELDFEDKIYEAGGIKYKSSTYGSPSKFKGRVLVLAIIGATYLAYKYNKK